MPRFTVNFRLLITKNQNLHKMYCYSALIELSILLRRLFLCQMYLSVPRKMHAPEGGEQTNGCEPVCINVSRIYDSCGAKDCLSNLPVMFTEANQKIIDGACSVKISNVRIITSTVDVEPVAFHRGFYSVDMMYYFAVTVEAYTAAGAIPETVTGLAMYGKRVVLYGGEALCKVILQ